MDFSIYLVESVDPSHEFIKDESLEVASTSISDAGDIYIFPAAPSTPSWIGEIRAMWPDADLSKLYGARCGVVVAITDFNVTFLATFGTGYLHVKRELVTPDFGRKVVITCVSPDHLKQVSRQAIEGTKLQSIEQTPKGESLDKYSIDYERDLLKGLAGATRKRAFGNYIAGADALHVSIPGGVADLHRRLRLYLKAYKMKIVSPDLRWYDRLKRVIYPSVIDKLNIKLNDALHNKTYLEPVLALPEIMDRTRAFFTYGFERGTRRSPAAQYTDPHIDDWRTWLATKNNAVPSLDEAKRRSFFVYDHFGNEVSSYKVHQCLLWSCNLSGKSYFLHAGSWYEISTSLVADVRNFLRQAYQTKSFVSWPKYSGGDEEAYNENVANLIPNMILMDKQNIVLKGAKTAIEPCDLIDINSKLLIFVKRKKTGSSGLAHLLLQVLNGVDAFFSHDPEMRVEMQKRMSPPPANFDPQTQPKSDEWTVIILILGVKRRGLPFFTLMGAKQVISTLRKRFGLDVCVEYA